MKLKPLPPADPVIRQSVSLRTSVHSMLEHYCAFYEQTYNSTIDMSTLVNQMMKDYMADDKEFQKALPALQKKMKEASDAGTPPASYREVAPTDTSNE